MRSLKGVDYFSTMQQAINRYVEKQELRDMLGYFIKYVGSSSYDAPTVLSLLIHMQYEQGLWYVNGGHVSPDYIVSNREVRPMYRDLLHFSNKK